MTASTRATGLTGWQDAIEELSGASTRATAAQPKSEAQKLYESWQHAQPNRGSIPPWDRATPEARAEWEARAVQQHSGNPASTEGIPKRAWSKEADMMESWANPASIVREKIDENKLAILVAHYLAGKLPTDLVWNVQVTAEVLRRAIGSVAAPELDVEAERRELVLRRLLAYSVGGALLYTDGGELQDASKHPWIDFKRDSIESIEKNLRKRTEVDLAARTAATSTAPAPDVHEVDISEGFFAGCKVKVDPNLPPDTVELRGANRVRLNIKTGEITEFAATGSQAERAPGWISVEDKRKPGVGQQILLYVRTQHHGEFDGHDCTAEGAEVAMGEYAIAPLDWDEPYYFQCYTSPISDNDWITHWMPLPAAPSPHSPVGAKEQDK